MFVNTCVIAYNKWETKIKQPTVELPVFTCIKGSHGAEYIFMSTLSTSTLLVDEYEYEYIAKTWAQVHF